MFAPASELVTDDLTPPTTGALAPPRRSDVQPIFYPTFEPDPAVADVPTEPQALDRAMEVKPWWGRSFLVTGLILLLSVVILVQHLELVQLRKHAAATSTPAAVLPVALPQAMAGLSDRFNSMQKISPQPAGLYQETPDKQMLLWFNTTSEGILKSGIFLRVDSKTSRLSPDQIATATRFLKNAASGWNAAQDFVDRGTARLLANPASWSSIDLPDQRVLMTAYTRTDGVREIRLELAPR